MTAESLEKYGLPGIAIIGLCYFIMYLMKEHKKEREETEKRQIETINKLDDLQRKEREQQQHITQKQFDQMNKNAVDGTEALTELSTIIKQIKR